MAAKKKQEKPEGVEVIPLESIHCAIDFTNNRLSVQKSPLKRLWMTPDMKTAFCESRHAVTNKLMVTKLNLDRFLMVDFFPDEGGTVIENSEVSQDASQ